MMPLARRLLPLVAALALTAAPAAAEGPLKIGFISTFSSPTATAGPDLRDGFKLGIKDSGGTLGGRPVELVIGDDQLKPDVGVLLARQMMEQDHVQLVTGITNSNVLLAVANAVLPRKIFMMSVNAGPSQLAGAGCSPYFFSEGQQNDTIAEAMGLYLQKQGIKSVYLVAQNYAAGRDMMAGFKRTFKGEIIGERYTPLTQFDFAADLAELRAAKPEATFTFLTSGNVAINFVKQYAEAGLSDSVPLYTLSMMLDEQTLPGIGDAAVGIQSSTHWIETLGNPANVAFLDHFRVEYGRKPSLYAAIAYDGARLLDAALKTVGGRIEDADAFRKAMETVSFDSVRGKFRFNTNHFPIQNFYLADVERDAGGGLRNAYRDVIVEDHADSYVDACKMTR